MKLDTWQKDILKTKGHICVRTGRQVGKSTIISIKAALHAVQNPKQNIMVIAAVERQAYLLFEKILAYLHDNHRDKIKLGTDRPTKHQLMLTNGSKIYCLPTGQSGYGIRGFTINLLIADEAAFINEEVWTAVTPMLAMTGGSIWLLSTPHGKLGYYYECFKDEGYTAFHINTEEVINTRGFDKDWTLRQKEMALKNLEREKRRMTTRAYAQEYLGEFVDELMQFFPTAVINQCMNLVKDKDRFEGDKFLGVDIAREGGDQTVLLSVIRSNRKIINMIDMELSKESKLTQTTRRILASDLRHKYKKIYIDDGGMGVGVFDPLLENEQTKRKVIAINNASRSIDRDNRRKKLLKEDLYSNLLHLMENLQVNLIDDQDIVLSLKSIQYEYKENGELKIYGRYSHITEALIRACWCMKDKTLNIYRY